MTFISGMEFKHEGKLHNILNALSYNQEFNEKKWVVDCLWVEGVTGEAYQDMNNKSYLGHELLRKFSCLDDNFVFFARIREYAISDDIDCVSTLEDFTKSRCIMIILVVDSCFYEIYAKNEDELFSIKNNLKSLLSIDSEVIPKGKITRTNLTV